MALSLLWEESPVIASLACLDPWLDICHSQSGKLGVFFCCWLCFGSFGWIYATVDQAGFIGYGWDDYVSWLLVDFPKALLYLFCTGLTCCNL